VHPFEDLIVPEKAVGLHWFGQSTLGIKDAAGTIVQVDPYYPHERPANTFIHTRPPLDESSLRTDFILLTHNHADHTCLESIERIRMAYPEVRTIGPVESSQAMQAAGMPADEIDEVTAGDQAMMGTMHVHTIWAKPPGGLPEDDIDPPDVQHLGFVVDTGVVRVYISGDPVHSFAEHESLLKPVRDLNPDVGFLTCHPQRSEFPSYEGAARMSVEIGLKAAMPTHHGCFVGGEEILQNWANHLPVDGPKPLWIDYNQAVVFTG
jgi:L-ascorbate metabolism protein UlaG (beta-lactamase superfamily)